MERDDRSSNESKAQPVTDTDQPEGKDAEASTLADREIEHVREKSESGNALDPLALDDPTGRSVESVVLRVGIAVVLVIVVGVLFAQVACKNMQLSAIPNFAEGTTEESVATAIRKGIMWGGEIVRFPSDTEVTSFDTDTGALTVTIEDSSVRSVEQALASAQAPAMALAMNVFEDPTIQTVTTVVTGHVSADTGEFTGENSDPIGQILTITWSRDVTNTSEYSCVVSGYDPFAVDKDSEVA